MFTLYMDGVILAILVVILVYMVCSCRGNLVEGIVGDKPKQVSTASGNAAVRDMCVFGGPGGPDGQNVCGLGWQDTGEGWKRSIPGQQMYDGSKFTCNASTSGGGGIKNIGVADMDTTYCMSSNENNEIVLDRSGTGPNCLWGISSKCGGEVVRLNEVESIEFDISIDAGKCSILETTNYEWLSVFMKQYNLDTGEIIPGTQNEADFVEAGTNISRDGVSTNFGGREPQKAWGKKLREGVNQHVTVEITPNPGNENEYKVSVSICDEGQATCSNDVSQACKNEFESICKNDNVGDCFECMGQNAGKLHEAGCPHSADYIDNYCNQQDIVINKTDIVTNNVKMSVDSSGNEHPVMFIVDNWVTDMTRGGAERFSSDCKFTIKDMSVIRKPKNI